MADLVKIEFFPLEKNYPPFNEFSIINPVIISGIIKRFCKDKNINLKFPNDIFVNRKKICGLLQELITFDNKNFLMLTINIRLLTFYRRLKKNQRSKK